jgi:alpha-glucan,water dikinase
MNVTEKIATRSGLTLQIGRQVGAQAMEINLRLDSPRSCLLHWGLRQAGQEAWRPPPPDVWPADTKAVNAAVQTPFAPRNGYSDIVIRLPASISCSFIDFALFFPDQRAWDNNNGQNYRIELPAGERDGASLEQAIQHYLAQRKVLFRRVFEVRPEGRLAAIVTREQNRFVIMLFSDIAGRLVLHWGIARYSSYEWFVPPPSLRPPGTVLNEEHTVQTPFALRDGLNQLRLEISEAEAPMGLQFVLKQVEPNRWLNDRGGNFFVPVRIDYENKACAASPELADIADRIIKAEMSRNSWTLMHRFNLCHDLLDEVADSVDGLALLFIWLRYSALRQLTWQRNYNTKPRELSHAEDRLTQKLAALYSRDSKRRPFLRLILASVGPGGDGQRIRDEILNIMHRHHIKEVAGHFLEEWHQKLHNNTTPDDIAICEAYLEFLTSNGDLDRFYRKLQEHAVTQQRLENLERPIRSRPDFVPHLKDALIHDFKNFLGILRSVHEGTDLETAINAAGPRLDDDTQRLLARVSELRRGQFPLSNLINEITEARRHLRSRLSNGKTSRELLYLDLGLEQFFRTAVECNLEHVTETGPLADLIAKALENRLFSTEDAELAACLHHWQRLKDHTHTDAGWALHAKSVIDRIARVVSELIDRTYQLLQPKAQLLGHAFHADAWIITLFSEEVVRGGSLDFVLSLLLHRLEPLLRKTARLGSWQIVSRGSGGGIVEVVEQLRSVQGRIFDGPRVILADKVNGDEEIPEGVTAVIAPDVTDIVSHVAVRARNAGLLFASCFDAGKLNYLKTLRGRPVLVRVNPAGDVMVEEVAGGFAGAPLPARPSRRLKVRPRFGAWALSVDEFDSTVTGGKAVNLASLAGKLPAWVHHPASVAVPFGVCEQVLAWENNRPIAERYSQLLPQAETEPTLILPELRDTILKLAAPPELAAALREKAGRARLPWPKDWEEAWLCLKRVWASKWNERAFYSRRTQGIAHHDLFMSVLVQNVIEADYSFVIHTVQPFTGKRDDLYVEMVLGLGETLVGNYPGRALSAVCDKHSKAARLLAYPSKSLALRGAGLIFRSDSNGEDLAGFAGAGLYDSVLLPAPQAALVDYSDERLVWHEVFQRETLERLTEIGLAVEAAAGAPQDIEGVLSKGEYYVVQTRPQVGIREG